MEHCLVDTCMVEGRPAYTVVAAAAAAAPVDDADSDVVNTHREGTAHHTAAGSRHGVVVHSYLFRRDRSVSIG
jgi:hypothetical protein